MTQTFTIVKKILLIRKRFEDNSLDLPSHIDLVLCAIESIPQYRELLRLKKLEKHNEDLIKEKYLEFLNIYFSEDNSAAFALKIQDKFQNSFAQQANVQPQV